MGSRSAGRALASAAGAWSAWAGPQPLNSQQHLASKYLDAILARLAPGTRGGGTSSASVAWRAACSSCASGGLRQRAGAGAAAAAAAAASGGSAAAAAAAGGPAAAGGARRGFATFTPTRLYPKNQRFTSEDAAFWGILAANAGITIAAKSEDPAAREFVLRHMRTSIEAVVDGRYHTVLTAPLAHLSAVHLALNMALLTLFRRVQPLAAGQVRLAAGCPAGCCKITARASTAAAASL